MTVKLYTPGKNRPNRVSLIERRIEFGKQVLVLIKDGYGDYPELAQRLVRDEIQKTIRDINEKLGMGGNFKNGCLYREKILDVWFQRGQGKQVCDHAIPVKELVTRFQDSKSPTFVELALSPVVRLSEQADKSFTKEKRTSTGWQPGLPLSRYADLKTTVIEIKTHEGDSVNPATWTDADHWDLVKRTADKTPELKEIIEHFEIKLGCD